MLFKKKTAKLVVVNIYTITTLLATCADPVLVLKATKN